MHVLIHLLLYVISMQITADRSCCFPSSSWNDVGVWSACCQPEHSVFAWIFTILNSLQVATWRIDSIVHASMGTLLVHYWQFQEHFHCFQPIYRVYRVSKIVVFMQSSNLHCTLFTLSIITTGSIFLLLSCH